MHRIVRKSLSVSPVGLALALALLSCSISYADVTYTDFTSWAAANPGYTTVTIPDDPSPGFTVLGTGNASVTYSGVQFSQSGDSSTDPDLFNIGSLDSGDPAVLSSASLTGDANILITLPQAVTALALDYGTMDGSSMTFTLSDGSVINQPSTAGGSFAVPDFFGVTESSPFTSVLLTTSDLALDLNNVSYLVAGPSVGTVAAPEPGTWPVLAIALACLAVAGWRRQKSKLNLN
jgi:hypothetical protein